MADNNAVYTLSQVAQNNGQNGQPAWVVVNGDVLDITKFSKAHPGGTKILMDFAGKDCTEQFYALHRHEVLERRLPRLKVGELRGYDRSKAPQAWTELSRMPYAEINMTHSPYWKESHHKLRMAYRKFLWDSGTYETFDRLEDTARDIPADIRKANGRAGVLALTLGRGEHLKMVPEPNLWSQINLKPEDMDQFHCAIMIEERSRMVCPGAEDALVAGISIGLGPVVHYGQPWTKQAVKDIIMGEKVICLAITEPQAGSDVSATGTRAVKSTDGTHYVVNGTKKWITNAMFADYATTLVRTGTGFGAGGLSMLLIDLKAPGVTVKKIPTDYSMAAGTGLIILEDVKVPVQNLLGKEGEGMKITMHNFNLERWYIISMTLARSRRILEESFLWANQRKAFGKPLIQQPVIRAKLGDMISQLESVYALYEKLTNLYNVLPREKHPSLGGPTAMLKFRATRTSNFISDHACQILGGRAVTKTGMGKSISRNQKSFKMASIYGGSEEIMCDLAVRQMLKQMPAGSKL